MDSTLSTQFLSSLSKFLQSICNGFVTFDETVQVLGYLRVTVDRNHTIDYVLKENVNKTGDNILHFSTKSFQRPSNDVDILSVEKQIFSVETKDSTTQTVKSESCFVDFSHEIATSLNISEHENKDDKRFLEMNRTWTDISVNNRTQTNISEAKSNEQDLQKHLKNNKNCLTPSNDHLVKLSLVCEELKNSTYNFNTDVEILKKNGKAELNTSSRHETIEKDTTTHADSHRCTHDPQSTETAEKSLSGAEQSSLQSVKEEKNIVKEDNTPSSVNTTATVESSSDNVTNLLRSEHSDEHSDEHGIDTDNNDSADYTNYMYTRKTSDVNEANSDNELRNVSDVSHEPASSKSVSILS